MITPRVRLRFERWPEIGQAAWKMWSTCLHGALGPDAVFGRPEILREVAAQLVEHRRGLVDGCTCQLGDLEIDGVTA